MGLPLLVLILVLIVALLMIPFGFPGTLVMLAAAICYKLLVPAGGIGWTTVAIVGVITVIAEVLETLLAARYAKRYGGSSRASWGAILGGMVGALVGVPVPIVGSSGGAVTVAPLV